MTRRQEQSKALAMELQDAERVFDAALKDGVVEGEFMAEAWTYRGIGILFSEISTKRSNKLSPTADKLARCFAAQGIKKHLTGTTLVAHVGGFRHLAASVKSDDDWYDLTRTHFDRAIKKLRIGNEESTVYHRANGITRFINYANRIAHKIAGKQIRFVRQVINWSHGIPNPIRAHEDITGPKRAERRTRLYKGDLGVMLGRARYAVWSDPSLEPSPGYDLIRLESLTFAVGLGLRMGEVTTLPLDAYQVDENLAEAYMRVATQKTHLPSAMGVPDVWKESFERAYAYLVETCAPARARARDIEERGFQFVYDKLAAVREAKPLPRSREAQLAIAGLDPSHHYLIAELVAGLEVTGKEFAYKGKYADCVLPLARPVAALIAIWIDERIRRWDWDAFAVPRYGEMRLPMEEVTVYAGAARSCGTKATWFAADMREFLRQVREDGYLNSSARPTQREIDRLVKRWKPLREKMLSHQGGAQSCVVSVERLVKKLADNYATALGAHLQEVVDSQAGMLGGGFRGKGKTRVGVPTRLSEHLIVVWEGQFSGSKSLGILPQPITRADYYNYLASNAQKKTVFQRLNLRDENGDVYSITPHDVRRWLTTALFRAGLSEKVADVWMGREVGQSRQYDYRTPKERAEYARSRYLQSDVPDDFLGRKVRLWREEGLTDEYIQKLIETKLKVLHFVPYGGCSRDLYQAPCNKGNMCIKGFGTGSSCPHFHVDRTDLVAKAEIQKMRDQYARQLALVDRDLPALRASFEAELNSTQPLDQHLRHMLDVLRGCDLALAAYDRFEGR
ncbi:hypothetical protein ACHZ97_19035 [Lysobacter soli]|uniref:hypothetical protein n=1 Tax=Lysobacter soli TaxID=453783 RepID=UPI0037C6788D